MPPVVLDALMQSRLCLEVTSDVQRASAMLLGF